jgi:regulator of protease activity HflC (stomatin/prohibitin superfamily)
MKTAFLKLTAPLMLLLFTSGCAVITQDEIAVKRRFGSLGKKAHDSGIVFFNPLTTRMMRLPARTDNIEVRLDLPSKEGLNISTEVSILYRIESEKIQNILSQSGVNYVKDIILPVFRSSAADVSARFFAKDMHSAQRADIEKAIRDQMMETLQGRGFLIENVLLKSVRLPDGLARAIEAKLEAEQDAQRMEFLIRRQELEAKRQMIEAQATRDAQKVLNEGLTPQIIQLRSIEAFLKVAESPNTKVIITDGKAPMIVGGNN